MLEQIALGALLASLLHPKHNPEPQRQGRRARATNTESAATERLSDPKCLIVPVHLALQNLLVSLLHLKHSPKHKTGWQSARANLRIRCYTALVRSYSWASSCQCMFCIILSFLYTTSCISPFHAEQPRRICMSFAFTLIGAAAFSAFSNCSQHTCMLSMFRSFFSSLY